MNMRRSGYTRTIEIPEEGLKTEVVEELLIENYGNNSYGAQLSDYNAKMNTIRLRVIPLYNNAEFNFQWVRDSFIKNSRNAGIELAINDNQLKIYGIVAQVYEKEKYVELLMTVIYDGDDIAKIKELIAIEVGKQRNRQMKNGVPGNARIRLYARQIEAILPMIKVVPRIENPPMDLSEVLEGPEHPLNAVAERIKQKIGELGAGYDVGIVEGTPPVSVETLIYSNYEVKTMTDTDGIGAVIVLSKKPGVIQNVRTLSTNVFRTAKRSAEAALKKTRIWGDVDFGSTAGIERGIIRIADGATEFVGFDDSIKMLLEGSDSRVEGLKASSDIKKKFKTIVDLKNKKTGKTMILPVDYIDHDTEKETLSLYGNKMEIDPQMLSSKAFSGEMRIFQYEAGF